MIKLIQSLVCINMKVHCRKQCAGIMYLNMKQVMYKRQKETNLQNFKTDGSLCIICHLN